MKFNYILMWIVVSVALVAASTIDSSLALFHWDESIDVDVLAVLFIVIFSGALVLVLKFISTKHHVGSISMVWLSIVVMILTSFSVRVLFYGDEVHLSLFRSCVNALISPHFFWMFAIGIGYSPGQSNEEET